MAIGWSLENFGESTGFGLHIAKKAAEVNIASMDGLRKAYQAGVVIATGTDADNQRASLAQECCLLTEAGMSPMEAILAATRTPAKILRLDHKIGTVEKGKIADLLIVNGNPAQDITCLKKVRHVIQGGKPLSLPEGGVRAPAPTLAEQVDLCLRHLEQVTMAGGADKGQVVEVSAFLVPYAEKESVARQVADYWRHQPQLFNAHEVHNVAMHALLELDWIAMVDPNLSQTEAASWLAPLGHAHELTESGPFLILNGVTAEGMTTPV